MTTELPEMCYENAASNLGHVNENDEECLRAAWRRLGVGKDGFLDRRELALVCECIGMEKVEEEVGVAKITIAVSLTLIQISPNTSFSLQILVTYKCGLVYFMQFASTAVCCHLQGVMFLKNTIVL
jgi:hypothetical protein